MLRSLLKLLVVPVAACILTIYPANATSTTFPSASSSYSGNDRVTTSNGASCSSYVGSSTRVEMGAVSDGRADNGVFARVVIPLGTIPKRVDCTKLSNLERRRQVLLIRRLEIENELLEAQLKNANAKQPASKGDDW